MGSGFRGHTKSIGIAQNTGVHGNAKTFPCQLSEILSIRYLFRKKIWLIPFSSPKNGCMLVAFFLQNYGTACLRKTGNSLKEINGNCLFC